MSVLWTVRLMGPKLETPWERQRAGEWARARAELTELVLELLWG
jgi:hypothetical protein